MNRTRKRQIGEGRADNITQMMKSEKNKEYENCDCRQKREIVVEQRA